MDDDRRTWLRLILLGALSGVLAGAVVLAFRSCVAFGQEWLLPLDSSGHYGALPPWLRLALPLGTGLLLGLLFDALPRDYREIGVVHVLKRLQSLRPQRLPAINMLVQFGGAVVAIVGGHSVDREGPAVHIGATSASLIGRRLEVTTEDQITLIASGSAAAIAAAFDTPLAAVVFVMEVLRIRYQVSRYLPVIIAAVVATVTSRSLALSEPGFSVAPEYLGSTWELSSLLVLGVAVGLLAVTFIGLSEQIARRSLGWPCSLSFTIAGLITGVLAFWVPQIMGTSYDTLAQLLRGEGTLSLVVALVAAKLLASACAVGLRIPGGLIGPTLFIGGAAGSALGLGLFLFSPLETASPGFYATIGMVAMMGATLRAPLAALTALLELTANPNIILPGMLAVASAELVTRLLRGQKSIFDVMADVQARAMTLDRSKNPDPSER
jgi:CIC family chloride channel protein